MITIVITITWYHLKEGADGLLKDKFIIDRSKGHLLISITITITLHLKVMTTSTIMITLSIIIHYDYWLRLPHPWSDIDR